jgi:TolB protein
MDGRKEGGNALFFFQPPTVREPFHEVQDFASDLYEHLTIETCEWSGNACIGPVIREFTSDGEPFRVIRMVESAKVFTAFWPTRSDDLDPEKAYRIIVKAAGAELGYADVDLVRRLRELWNIDYEEYVGIKDDWILPIVFSVEVGAVHVVDETGGQIVAELGEVVVDLPPDAVTEDVGITVQPVTENLAAQGPEPVPETIFDFGPDGLTFSQPVELTISYNQTPLVGADEESLRIHKLVDDKWEVVPDGTVNLAAKTATAQVEGFSTYSIIERALEPIPAEYSILYSSSRWQEGWGIFSQKPVVGGTPELLITGPGPANFDPAVSPDGRRIAYSSNPGHGDSEIYVANTGGVVVNQLTDNDVGDSHPDWSPDGEELVIERLPYRGFVILPWDLSGSETSLPPFPPVRRFKAPDWHPSGDSIAFQVQMPNDSMAIFTMEAPSGLTGQLLESGPYHNLHPDWSPDGKRLVIESDEFGGSDIFSLELTASGGIIRRRLTHSPEGEGYPQWSPDGRHIVYQTYQDGPEHIWVMNADGSGQTQITNEFASRRPTWAALLVPPAVPEIATNTGLTVAEGGSGTITDSHLEAWDSDDILLTYTIGSAPEYGTVEHALNGALSASSTFTQEDIDQGRISYTHDGSENYSDSFTFTVSDGVFSIAATVFDITVTPVNDPPVIPTKTGPRSEEP